MSKFEPLVSAPTLVPHHHTTKVAFGIDSNPMFYLDKAGIDAQLSR